MQKQIDAVAEDLQACKTEVGQQMELIRAEVTQLKEGIDTLLEIFDAAKGFVKISNWEIGRAHV